MRRLLIDIGNSRAKWAWDTNGNGPTGGGASPHVQTAWLDHLAADCHEKAPEQVWVSSVAAEETVGQFNQFSARQWGITPVRAATQARACGLICGYEQPERLGVDRWLASIGAFHQGPGSVLVADAGTAMTVDYVDAAGRHGGGLITPGLASLRAALRGGTQVRAHTESAYEPAWLARDTDPAVSLGTLHSLLEFLRAAHRELAPDRLLITGGEAPLFAPLLGPEWRFEPQLVLKGLSLLANTDTQATRAHSPR